MFSIQRFSVIVLILGTVSFLGCGGSGSSASSKSQDTSAVPGPPLQNSLLTGTYAFAVADQGCNCRFSAAGSFHADGSGNISSGVMDINNNNVVQAALQVTGTYSVGVDHRGTATLKSGNTSLTFRFVVINAKRAFVIGFDTHQNASGTMDLQDASAFSTASLAGPFAFRAYGIDTFGEAIQMGGVVTADGSGGISSGIMDVHDNDLITTELPVQKGTLAVGASNGRGTASMVTPNGTNNLAFYVIDSNHLKLIGTDPAPVLVGDAYRQPTAPAVNGSYVFTAFGWSTGVPKAFAAGGVFSSDGNGNISTGSEDSNINGAVNQKVAVTGSYAIQGTGRGTMTLNGASGSMSFAIYPSMAGIQFVEIDASQISGGMAFRQQGAPFSAASLTGGFVFSAAGFAGENADALAIFVSDGKGSLSGTADLNSVGAPQAGLALSGSYSLNGNSGNATLKNPSSTANLALYPVSSSQVLTLSLDSNAVMIGSIEQQ